MCNPYMRSCGPVESIRSSSPPLTTPIERFGEECSAIFITQNHSDCSAEILGLLNKLQDQTRSRFFFFFPC